MRCILLHHMFPKGMYVRLTRYRFVQKKTLQSFQKAGSGAKCNNIFAKQCAIWVYTDPIWLTPRLAFRLRISACQKEAISLALVG